jgi:hypothetical protein
VNHHYCLPRVRVPGKKVYYVPELLYEPRAVRPYVNAVLVVRVVGIVPVEDPLLVPPARRVEQLLYQRECIIHPPPLIPYEAIVWVKHNRSINNLRDALTPWARLKAKVEYRLCYVFECRLYAKAIISGDEMHVVW